jgi:hypothetical protein
MAQDYKLIQAKSLGERLGRLGRGIDSSSDFDEVTELKEAKEEGYISGISYIPNN